MGIALLDLVEKTRDSPYESITAFFDMITQYFLNEVTSMGDEGLSMARR